VNSYYVDDMNLLLMICIFDTTELSPPEIIRTRAF